MKEKEFPYTQNRELSWLRFNQRVLEEAATTDVELLERLNFLAIFTSNLDEFYMVRVGSINDIALVDDSQIDAKSGMKPSETLNAVYAHTKRLYPMRDRVYKNIFKTLKQLQIEQVSFKGLDKKEVKAVNRFFERSLIPLVNKQIISSRHPFPFLNNKEVYLFFRLQKGGKSHYGFIPIPDYIERIFYLNEEKTRFILSEEIIYQKLEEAFPGARITFKTMIRLTRNADVNLDPMELDEDEDYRQYMKKILKRRNRLAPVRLEVYKDIDKEALNYLCKQLGMSKKQIFISKTAPLDMSFISTLTDNLPAEKTKLLSYAPFKPQPSRQLYEDEPLIAQIEQEDILLSYPYEDINIFLKLLKEASEDPNVVSIKITIYRVAKYSRVVHYLCRAAENGKDVTVLLELRARFDENNNIEMAERLEEAGCHILYGLEDYKVHSKLLVITYKDQEGKLKTITQIGTGNYNEKTSTLYTDFSYLTAREDVGKDALNFFQNMNTADVERDYPRLLVSPKKLKNKVLSLLDEEIEKARNGKPALARFKLNSITDRDIMEKLARASQAGVRIEMMVRGICCILPGLEGYTENIEIHQIVGRFLEHGRLYAFGQGEEARIFISSADFMTRNTEKRVEVGVEIVDPKLKKRLSDYFNLQFSDNKKGRKLLPTGLYALLDPRGEFIDAQALLMEEARTVQKEARKEKSEPKPGLLARLKARFARKTA